MKQKIKIIKIGGNVVNNREALSSFLFDFAKIEELKILVHGGGNQATEMANELNINTEMIEGRRITDKANLKIATMVYAGQINKSITAELQLNNCNAIGLTGADANLILAHKRTVKTIDYGFAGDIDEINGEMIKLFLENNLTPVFCAITHDKKGQLLNTNADTIASEVASDLVKYYDVELIYCFDKIGLLKKINNDDSLIEKIDLKSVQNLKEQGVINGGMLPKIDNCFYALQNGVREVIIGKPEIIRNNNLKYTSLVL